MFEALAVGCKQLLQRYTYRHNQMLKQLVGTIRDAIDMSLSVTVSQRPGSNFIPSGTLGIMRKATQEKRTTWVRMENDWVLAMDGDGASGGTVSGSVVRTTLLPYIVLYFNFRTLQRWWC